MPRCRRSCARSSTSAMRGGWSALPSPFRVGRDPRIPPRAGASVPSGSRAGRRPGPRRARGQQASGCRDGCPGPGRPPCRSEPPTARQRPSLRRRPEATRGAARSRASSHPPWRARTRTGDSGVSDRGSEERRQRARGGACTDRARPAPHKGRPGVEGRGRAQGSPRDRVSVGASRRSSQSRARVHGGWNGSLHARPGRRGGG